MAGQADSSVNLLATVEFLHGHLTSALCRRVYKQQRVKERDRKWTFWYLVRFWTAVILRAPESLTQALGETGAKGDRLWPKVQAEPEAFFQKCKSFKWEFFFNLYRAFIQSILPEAPRAYAQSLGSIWERFPEIRAIDGSRCDQIAHRLKILWKEKAVVLPGCLSAVYDLARGIPSEVIFCADAAQHEHLRTEEALVNIPKGTLMLGDRLYGVPDFIRKLTEKGISGLFRYNKTVKFKILEVLSRRQGSRAFLEDLLVEAGSGQRGAKVKLRLIRHRQKGIRRDLITSVLDPLMLSAEEALALYPFRWTIERMFFDLKEVLNLHSFYAANANAVAMQVYAAAIVHAAFRIAQAKIAQQKGIAPEAISPAKLFPRLAAISVAVTGIEIYRMELYRLNPGVKLVEPELARVIRGAIIPLAAILVEHRKGKRRKRKFSPLPRRWKSLAHVSGFQN